MYKDDVNASLEVTRQYRAKPKKLTSINTYDIGWIILSIGMAIGAGTVIVPVQIGLTGLWVFSLAFLIAYPATYMLQELYLKTLSESTECDNYTHIISQYLGKNWGILLGFIYFSMIIHGIFIYSTAIIYDSASYLKTYGVTDTLLSNSMWYRIIVFSALVLLASYGEKVLFKIANPMVITKVFILLVLAVVMLPQWNIANIMAFPPFGKFIKDVLTTLPFCFFSVVFVQILNPMNIAYRKIEPNKQLATARAIRTHRLAYLILVTIILFFSFSVTLTLSHEQAISAFNQNISALALAAEVLPGFWISLMSVVLNIFAVLTAFFAIYLGLRESVHGIIVNILQRVLLKQTLNVKIINGFIFVFVVLLLSVWVSYGVSVVNFFALGSPLYGIVSCLIPCLLVFKVKELHYLKGIKLGCIFIFGCLMVISPFLGLIK